MPEMSKVVLIGATGAVGEELLGVLAERDFSIGALRVCASDRSAGRTCLFGGEERTIEVATPDVLEGADLVFMSADAETSRQLGPEAVARGCTVIDNSSAFRMDASCPLIVPEVNGDQLDAFTGPGIIANPNCSTIIALMALAPLRALGRITRITACTYQAISGAGQAAMNELEAQAQAWADEKPMPTDAMGRQVIFNCFSHESPIGADGMNTEERKLQDETRRILGDDSIEISATCMRVPVLRAHTEALHVIFDRPIDPEAAAATLAAAGGLSVVDDPQPIDATGGDDVLVGRIRRDHGVADGRGLALIACGDQLRKGAALNAVQIAERLAQRSRVTSTDVGGAPSRLP